ncbi:hypothetical protein [Dyella japonica]|uniref:DUF4123 domain-containing protein n=1 Tax=Dyella japonica TaxID=231455 RepID=A0ABV2K0Z0_9GAMM
MNAGIVQAFVDDKRTAADYLYVLLDPLAECGDAHSLGVAALTERLGDDAIVRVPRADLAHDPETFPALVMLAAPGVVPDADLLAALHAYAMSDVDYRKRYVCGWLTSPMPPASMAAHLASLCQFAPQPSTERFIPIFEPPRLELLAATVRGGLDAWLWPVRHWLYPSSWGSFALFNGSNHASTDWPARVYDVQREAPTVSHVLAAWRRAQRDRLSYAPRRWHGDTVLPPQAASEAFRMIRDARKRGLRDTQDIVVLSLHRLVIHPNLPEHPKVRDAIRQTARGEAPLSTLFDSYDDHAWARIAAYLDAHRDEL